MVLYMKKINYIYFICLVLILPVMDYLFSLLPFNFAWILLLLVYSLWFVLSVPLIYMYKKNKGVKEGFITYYCMKAEWSVFWIDISHKELAYLCFLNPFKIHYVPLSSVNSAKVAVSYHDKENINHISCCFNINGKACKVRVETSATYSFIKTEPEGRKIIEKTQKFVDILNRDFEIIQ